MSPLLEITTDKGFDRSACYHRQQKNNPGWKQRDAAGYHPLAGRRRIRPGPRHPGDHRQPLASRLHVRGRRAVGDREGERADVVRHDAEGFAAVCS